MKPILTENFTAEAAVSPYRICKAGAADGGALMGAAATDALFGVADELGADAAGDRLDIHTVGLAEVEYGGAVTRGDQLTSDASGRGVTAAAGNRGVGIARVSGVLGDIGQVQISPGTV